MRRKAARDYLARETYSYLFSYKRHICYTLIYSNMLTGNLAYIFTTKNYKVNA